LCFPLFGAALVVGVFARQCVVFVSDLSTFRARGDVVAARQQLAWGANPDEAGFPSLRTIRAGVSAPLSAHFKVVELLVQAGADVNAAVSAPEDENSNLTTPLRWSVEKGSAFLEMTLLLLLKKGADLTSWEEREGRWTSLSPPRMWIRTTFNFCWNGARMSTWKTRWAPRRWWRL
jgi:hypothetical protein